MNPARRSFLFGFLNDGIQPVRHPWSLPESLLIERCTRCGDCIRSCENTVLRKGAGEYPEMHFESGGCSFCGKCVASCKTGALSQQSGDAPWTLKASIGATCLAQQKVICRTCGERCEIGAIHFRLEKGGISMPHIDAARCNGCGMCIPDCPTQAITVHSMEHTDEVLS